MSRRAQSIVAMCTVPPESESPAPPGDVPPWFRKVLSTKRCSTTSDESEMPLEKRVRKRLDFKSPAKTGSDVVNHAKHTQSKILSTVNNENLFKESTAVSNSGFLNDDVTLNSTTVFGPIAGATVNVSAVNSTVLELPAVDSIQGNTDGDYFPPTMVMQDPPDNFVTLSNMPIYTIDQYLLERDDVAPPETEEQTAQSQTSQINEEVLQGEENVEEQDNAGVPEGMVTPIASTHQSRVDAPRKPARKRVACPSTWKSNQRKEQLNFGKAHISTTGKERKERVLGPGCTEKCNRCKTRLTLEEREELRSKFWALGKHQRQLDYIVSRIKSATPQKKYAEPGKKGKQSIRVFLFQINGKDIRVCKKMFLDTLVICDSWIQTATNNCRGETGFAPLDMRGKHNNRAIKVNEDAKNSVREHINLIPRVESHYTRSKSKREYVENGLSIEELYRRYRVWVAPKNLSKLPSERTYRKIFNEEFNIGFFKPKKDQCALCAKWKHATTEQKAGMARQYALHTQNRNSSQSLKDKDKKEAEKEENFGKICVASFDMQKILSCPKSEVSEFYYKSKLNLYNFTIFDMAPRLGTCYMWNETEGKKGSAEVASGLYHFIEKKKKEGVTELIFYSDNPTSQNKNRYVFSMYLLASTKFSLKITHRFLEVGHTHMEVDSMHAAIEKSVDKKEIFDVEEWYSHILNAKKNGKHRNDPAVKYSIEKAGQTYNILDFKPLVEKQNWDYDTNKNKVHWMKIREVSFDPEKPCMVFLKYDYSATAPIEVNVKERKGRPVNLLTYQPSKAYKSRFPLTVNKIKDLKDLMRTEAIPSKYHPFYQSLLEIGTAPIETEHQCPNDCPDCEHEDDQEVQEESVDKNNDK